MSNLFHIPLAPLIKAISNIVIRDEQDVYSILTNREKLECLLQEYENNHQSKEKQQQVCCDENVICMNSNKKIRIFISRISK